MSVHRGVPTCGPLYLDLLTSRRLARLEGLLVVHNNVTLENIQVIEISLSLGLFGSEGSIWLFRILTLPNCQPFVFVFFIRI